MNILHNPASTKLLLSLVISITFLTVAQTVSIKKNQKCPFVSPLSKRLSFRGPRAHNVIFFTDGTNFDDVITLIYLAKSPRTNVIAIYITQNGWASAAPSLRHMFNILHLMSNSFRTVPIFIGGYYALSLSLIHI